MSEEKTSSADIENITESKLTPEEQIEFLQRKLREAELEATDKNIALIEMTAARNVLYKSLQDTQMRLADTISQRENDIEAYQKELEARLKEKRDLQEQYDGIVIKAKRYDELQESVVKIKMNAEVRAHDVIDEAQEKAMDAIMLIDNIAKEIDLFRQDTVYLRRDIKIGTVTLDDRLENIYLRLCKNLDKLMKIKENFCIKNSLPINDEEVYMPKNAVPVIDYPKNTEQESEEELKV